MTKWKCTVCRFVYEGETLPPRCPLCGAPSEKLIPFSCQDPDTQPYVVRSPHHQTDPDPDDACRGSLRHS